MSFQTLHPYSFLGHAGESQALHLIIKEKLKHFFANIIFYVEGIVLNSKNMKKIFTGGLRLKVLNSVLQIHK